MMSEIDTILMLDSFFRYCFEFWVKNGKQSEQAFYLALQETSKLEHDPFSPQGDMIQKKVLQKYIEYRKIKGEPK